MAGYRYLAVDLLTHQPLAELPLTGVTYGQTLNQAGPCGGTLTLPANDSTLASFLIDATIPLRRALYVERDGVLMWGGPIWARDMAEPSKVKIAALEWWSLFNRRIVVATQTFAATDQLTIAQDLVTYAQAKVAGQLGVTVGTERSGVLRDRTYNGYEFKPIGEAVAQLAAVDDGFDFAIDVAYESNATISRTFRCSYPFRGRVSSENGLVWETGKNIVSLGWPADGADATNSVYALGSGDGDDMLTAHATRADLWEQGYPLLESSMSLRDVSVFATLQAHATAESRAKGEPVVLPPVKVRGDLDPVLGSYITGDEARIRVDRGSDPRFPEGLDEVRRIVAWSARVPDSGAAEEEVTLTLDRTVS